MANHSKNIAPMSSLTPINNFGPRKSSNKKSQHTLATNRRRRWPYSSFHCSPGGTSYIPLSHLAFEGTSSSTQEGSLRALSKITR